jgi:hypothetical protein
MVRDVVALPLAVKMKLPLTLSADEAVTFIKRVVVYALEKNTWLYSTNKTLTALIKTFEIIRLSLTISFIFFYLGKRLLWNYFKSFIHKKNSFVETTLETAKATVG